MLILRPLRTISFRILLINSQIFHLTRTHIDTVCARIFLELFPIFFRFIFKPSISAKMSFESFLDYFKLQDIRRPFTVALAGVQVQCRTIIDRVSACHFVLLWTTSAADNRRAQVADENQTGIRASATTVFLLKAIRELRLSELRSKSIRK